MSNNKFSADQVFLAVQSPEKLAAIPDMRLTDEQRNAVAATDGEWLTGGVEEDHAHLAAIG